ncbi:hypothetical protein Peur_053680 [Populus x canadensis]
MEAMEMLQGTNIIMILYLPTCSYCVPITSFPFNHPMHSIICTNNKGGPLFAFLLFKGLE